MYASLPQEPTLADLDEDGEHEVALRVEAHLEQEADQFLLRGEDSDEDDA
jgi:hypothetical protein